MYQRARAGEVKDFTGLSAPYEVPKSPELTIDTATQDIQEGVAAIMAYIHRTGVLHGQNEDAGSGI